MLAFWNREEREKVNALIESAAREIPPWGRGEHAPGDPSPVPPLSDPVSSSTDSSGYFHALWCAAVKEMQFEMKQREYAEKELNQAQEALLGWKALAFVSLILAVVVVMRG